MKKVAFLFPGQGAQTVGMGKEFYDSFEVARKTFEEANEILGYRISDLIFEGPQEKLTRTEYSQLAIFIVSVAIYRSFQHLAPQIKPSICAGLSLGEYSALFASGRVSFKDALLVVQKRASFMSEACDSTDGTMAAVLGLDEASIEQAVAEMNPPHDLWVANFNCPGQTVISGAKSAIDSAKDVLKEKGAKRVLPLEVHGAFHSGYMKSAEESLRPFVEKLDLKDSKVQFVMNVPGNFETATDKIRENLIAQVTNSVRWQQGIEAVKDQVDIFLEIGPGKTLFGMNKKMGLAENTFSINTPKELEEVLEKMNQYLGDANAAT